jgi:hypothetical protein
MAATRITGAMIERQRRGRYGGVSCRGTRRRCPPWRVKEARIAQTKPAARSQRGEAAPREIARTNCHTRRCTQSHENGGMCAWSAVRRPMFRGPNLGRTAQNVPNSEKRQSIGSLVSTRDSPIEPSLPNPEKGRMGAFSATTRRTNLRPLAGGGTDDPERKLRERSAPHRGLS